MLFGYKYCFLICSDHQLVPGVVCLSDENATGAICATQQIAAEFLFRIVVFQCRTASVNTDGKFIEAVRPANAK